MRVACTELDCTAPGHTAADAQAHRPCPSALPAGQASRRRRQPVEWCPACRLRMSQPESQEEEHPPGGRWTPQAQPPPQLAAPHLRQGWRRRPPVQTQGRALLHLLRTRRPPEHDLRVAAASRVSPHIHSILVHWKRAQVSGPPWSPASEASPCAYSVAPSSASIQHTGVSLGAALTPNDLPVPPGVASGRCSHEGAEEPGHTCQAQRSSCAG